MAKHSDKNPRSHKDRFKNKTFKRDHEKKMHRVGSENRSKMRESLKKVMRGEMDESEFEESFGETEEI